MPEGGHVARLADGGGDDAVVPTYCFEIKEVIGMRFADPERLVGKKRRNELAAAETSLCYLTRGKFGEDQNDDGFIDTRWVELEEKKTVQFSKAKTPAYALPSH